MPTCFVIQPFDKGQYDKRYDQVFTPAITKADLEPYRVDKDLTTTILIDSIERNIRDATVCLADITSDNPNVWYELGYAFACGIPVVMVCGPQRAGSKYPFDIQHRTVISYASDAPADFTDLQVSITSKLAALVKGGAAARKLASSEQVVAAIEGISQGEMTVLGLLAGDLIGPDDQANLWSLQQRSEQNSLTKLGCTLSLRKLRNKGFVRLDKESDENGNVYDVVTLESVGWDWIENNEDKFNLTISKPEVAVVDDDDIPF